MQPNISVMKVKKNSQHRRILQENGEVKDQHAEKQLRMDSNNRERNINKCDKINWNIVSYANRFILVCVAENIRPSNSCRGYENAEVKVNPNIISYGSK